MYKIAAILLTRPLVSFRNETNRDQGKELERKSHGCYHSVVSVRYAPMETILAFLNQFYLSTHLSCSVFFVFFNYLFRKGVLEMTCSFFGIKLKKGK